MSELKDKIDHAAVERARWAKQIQELNYQIDQALKEDDAADLANQQKRLECRQESLQARDVKIGDHQDSLGNDRRRDTD